MSTAGGKPRTERRNLGLARDAFDNILIGHPGECWPAGKTPNSSGYTNLHRIVASLFVDVNGRHVHHTCKTLTCANPDHLVVMTPREHYDEHLQAECLNGHDMMDESNVRWYRGSRWCRACDAARRRRYRRERVHSSH